MNWLQKDQPLGLPPGSVRAIMALALIVTTLVLFVKDGAAPTELLTLDGAVAGVYFGAKLAKPS